MSVEKTSPKMIVITGPTASGKTGRAVDVAKALGGEVISADSRQLYRGMDIGTGKDLAEYGEIPYHMCICVISILYIMIYVIVDGCPYFVVVRDCTSNR